MPPHRAALEKVARQLIRGGTRLTTPRPNKNVKIHSSNSMDHPRKITSALSRLPMASPYSVVLPAAFTLAHLALAAAASLALTAGLLRRSFFLAAFTLAHLAFVPAIMAALPAALNRFLPFLAFPLTLAHLARCAAAILARTAADLRCFFGSSTANGDGTSPPPAVIESIWPCSASICSLMAMMRWSWLVVKLVRFVMRDGLIPGALGVNPGDVCPSQLQPPERFRQPRWFSVSEGL